MKKLLLVPLLLLLVVVPARAQDDGFPRTLVDGLGAEVTIAAPPHNIVSLSLAVDETLLPLLGADRFAAVTALAQDPGISNVAVLASRVENTIVSSDDTEQIIALEPDLVFAASFTAPEVVQQLRDAGLTVFTTDYAVGFDAVRDNIRLLGQAVGEEQAAETLVEKMDGTIAGVSGIVARDSALRVLYLTPGNYTSGADSTISEIITAANGLDVAAAAGIDQFAPLSDEFIIEQDPDVILLSGWTPYDPTFIQTFRDNPAFASLSAVQNQRVYVAYDAHLTAVSQFIAEGVKDVAAYLYPDSYPAFPITLTDARGRTVTVESPPESMLIELPRMFAPQDMFLVAAYAASETMDVRYRFDGMELEFEPDIAFINRMVAGVPPERTVLLYPDDTPAADVANTLLMGEATGERIAALTAIGSYTDYLESKAAES